MERLLLVEDDASLALGVEFTLKDEGYMVDIASTFTEGKELADRYSYSLIILDVNLPDGSGYELCKVIRMKSDVPIIFLTALDDEVNVVLGLEIGGDDYITKPFRVKELLSRVKALIRRNKKNTSLSNKLKSGELSVDLAAAIVMKGKKEIPLTGQEYRLLLIFMNKPHTLMNREDILRQLTDDSEAFFDENTLAVYIKRIREKIEDNAKQPDYIVTQRGMGYKWNRDVEKES